MVPFGNFGIKNGHSRPSLQVLAGPGHRDLGGFGESAAGH